MGSIMRNNTTTFDNNTFNGGDDDDEEEASGGVPAVYVHEMIYLSVLAVFGIIANAIVLVKSIRYESSLKGASSFAKKNSTNFLVINLALSDLGTATFTIGVAVLPMHTHSFPITPFFCEYIQPFRELFVAVTVFSIAFIAVGRYLILLKALPRKPKLFSSSLFNSIMLWVLSYFIFAFPFSSLYTVEYSDGVPSCEANWKTPMAQRVHTTTIIAINIAVPTVLVFGSYIGIIQRLRRARLVVTPMEIGTTSTTTASKTTTLTPATKPRNSDTVALSVHSHRIVKISMLLLLGFFITYLPFASMILALEYDYLQDMPLQKVRLMFVIFRCLIHSGVIIHPLILIASSDLYRPKYRLRFWR